MTLGIMQPYFMPYIGYWQLIKAVDKYVVYDDVNYIKRGWVNRNNILINGSKSLFSISLKEASQNKHFNEIYIADDFTKLRKSLQACYSKAPYYKDVMPLMDCIFNYEDKLLSKFLKNSIDKVLEYLHIETEIVFSSEIEKNNALKGQEKILEICKILNADTYYNAIGGQELYDKEEFKQNGINLYFLDTEMTPYRQYKNEFVSYLSMIDILMFNSPDEINRMLDNYWELL